MSEAVCRYLRFYVRVGQKFGLGQEKELRLVLVLELTLGLLLWL